MERNRENYNRHYIPTLDGWRSIAILLVLVDHSGDFVLRPLLITAGVGLASVDSSFELLKELIGSAGVHIFFALSGYLITRNLLAEETARGSVSVRGFYVRRLFRIQPASIVVLLAIAVLGSVGVIAVNPLGLIGALLGFANLVASSQTWYTGHYWSLAVEEQFYLVWPIVFTMAKTSQRLQIIIAIVVVDILWRVISFKFQIATSWNYPVRTDIQAEWLLWGCVAAIAGSHEIGTRALHRLSAPGWNLLALPLIALSVVGPFIHLNWKVDQLLTSAAALTTPLLFVGTAQRPAKGLGRILECVPLRWLGRLSYSLYLWQQMFIVWRVARAPALSAFQTAPENFGFALLLAAASYYLIERPFIRIGRRFITPA
jgi:peptidoglycan/LPS O-acetylase OafA/YrhL